MKRRNILDIGEDIFKLLLKGDKLSVHNIAQKIRCEWRTAIRVLEFLKVVSVVKEKKVSTGRNRYERIFYLR
jgi:predicted transcriptional regulator